MKKYIYGIGVLSTLSLSLAGLSQVYYKKIVELVKNNPNQLSVQEYSLIAETIYKKAPCNVLVFGLGRDSSLWLELNKGGKTVFLENNVQWFNRIKEQIPSLEAYLIKYETHVDQWKVLLEQGSKNLLKLELPPHISAVSWDIIFVDAPLGVGAGAPGRMKSIYTAARLASKSEKQVDVFVHDCNRMVEKTYCNAFFQTKNLKGKIDRLRHYSLQ